MDLKLKAKQLFCRHRETGEYTKKQQFHSLSGERIYVICESCKKEIDSYLLRYD